MKNTKDISPKTLVPADAYSPLEIPPSYPSGKRDSLKK